MFQILSVLEVGVVLMLRSGRNLEGKKMMYGSISATFFKKSFLLLVFSSDFVNSSRTSTLRKLVSNAIVFINVVYPGDTQVILK